MWIIARVSVSSEPCYYDFFFSFFLFGWVLSNPNLRDKYSLSFLLPVSVKTPYHILKVSLTYSSFWSVIKNLLRDTSDLPCSSPYHSPSWHDVCFRQNNTSISENAIREYRRELLFSFQTDPYQCWKVERSPRFRKAK